MRFVSEIVYQILYHRDVYLVAKC